MWSTRLLILLNFTVLAVYGYLFLGSLYDQRGLVTKVNFLMFAMVTFVCLMIGWLYSVKKSHSGKDAYTELKTGSFEERVKIVKMHVLLVVTSILYLNIFLSTLATYIATDHLHLIGMLSLCGFISSRYLARRYLHVKKKVNDALFESTFQEERAESS